MPGCSIICFLVKKLWYMLRGLFIKMPRFECLRCGIAISKASFPLGKEQEYPACPLCGKDEQVDIALCYDDKPLNPETVIFESESREARDGD